MRAAALIAIALAGCGSCQKGPPSELRVEGDHPFVRCLGGDPPEDRSSRVGDGRLVVEDGVLTIDGLRSNEIVAFAGPGPSDALLDDALSEVRAESPALVLVLGSIGDELPIASRTLATLATLDVPVLVLAGGRDDASVWKDAFEALGGEARDRVIDVTVLRKIVVGDRELIPVGGAPLGRYARTETACGFTEEDLAEVVERAGQASEGRRRFLLSWAAPSGAGLEGIAGADPGEPRLAAAAEEMGAVAGAHAWPAAASTERATMVRPLVGPAVELGDGALLLPGHASLP